MKHTLKCLRDFFLDKQREKAKLELEMKMIVTMRQIIPAGEATRDSPLGVILSQFHISHADFCPDFNSKTAQWTPGIPLTTRVVKGFRAKEYKLYLSTPSVPFLIDSVIDEDTNKLQIASLYDAIRFKSMILKKPLKPTACMFLSTLHSFHIKKIIIRR